MLKKTAHNADHANIVRNAGQTRTQTADTSHDQIDRDAFLRSLIKRANHFRVGKTVQLGNNSAGTSGAMMFDLAFNQTDHSYPQMDRRDKELAIVALPGIAGEKIEEFRS